MSAMQRKDYYVILGIARDADETEIKRAYRKLALQNHPDTNRDDPQAEDRFKEISEAYEVLIHKDKREIYDLGGDPVSGGSPFRRSPFDPWADPFEAGFFTGFRCRGGGFGRGLGRWKRAFWGMGGRPPGFTPNPSQRQVHDLPLTVEEAYEGTERDIRLHTGRDTLFFTITIPPGVEDGTLFSFKRPIGDAQEVTLLFRVRITE